MKPFLTYPEQLRKLRERGCVIADENRALQILAQVNYYRLSAYLLPFKNSDETYRAGTTLQRVYQIYEFDRRLRLMLFSALEEVEIFLRAKLSFYHAQKYGAGGYGDARNFNARHQHQVFLEHLQKAIAKHKTVPFVAHHLEKYGGEFPLWVAVEIFTFGMLSRFYADMPLCDQQKFAKEVFNTTPSVLESWLRCGTTLRNICAHYGRLYFQLFSVIPAAIVVADNAKRRLWAMMLCLRRLYPDAAKWHRQILPALESMVNEYADDIDLRHLGFPENWTNLLRR
ncbi:CAAX amino protease [Planctomycetales bacterium]|nr:CAAX amino protease [Planctomycetales bacterium]GHT06356.1 CAAX amino protease [Planctomycetales bacterium]